MPRILTDPQLTTLCYLAINEMGYSSTELVKMLDSSRLKMDKPRFSRDILKPLLEKKWITIEKSSGNYRPGRPKEILKITRDISTIFEIATFALMKEKEYEIKNIEIHKEAQNHADDVDFDPESWDLKIDKIETSLEFYAYTSSTFYELKESLFSDIMRRAAGSTESKSPTVECTPNKPLSAP